MGADCSGICEQGVVDVAALVYWEGQYQFSNGMIAGMSGLSSLSLTGEGGRDS